MYASSGVVAWNGVRVTHPECPRCSLCHTQRSSAPRNSLELSSHPISVSSDCMSSRSALLLDARLEVFPEPEEPVEQILGRLRRFRPPELKTEERHGQQLFGEPELLGE